MTADPAAAAPRLLFIVDTCELEEELGFLKSALAQAFELLPEKSLVGLVTFGAYMQVHELGYGHVPNCYAFKGTKEVARDQILEQMSFFAKSPKPPVAVVAGLRDGLSAESVSRFLLPASECEFVVNSLLDELQKDPLLIPNDQRATRCTSTALSVAASLLGACVPGSAARLWPSFEGQLQKIMSKNLSERIRSHKDLDKHSAPHYHKAVKFYEGLSKQLVNQGHALDAFAWALDQAFALLLKAPQGDAESIIKGRFPVPRLVVCDQHGSQARFLLAKLNPSATYNSDSRLNPGGDIIFTDDVSLEVFLDHLRRLVVQ